MSRGKKENCWSLVHIFASRYYAGEIIIQNDDKYNNTNTRQKTNATQDQIELNGESKPNRRIKLKIEGE